MVHDLKHAPISRRIALPSIPKNDGYSWQHAVQPLEHAVGHPD
jgi:hypothetical protein